MSLLFKNNLPKARRFFIGSTLFFSGWTALNLASVFEANPLWDFHGLTALAVFGKSCGSAFCWWLTEKRLKNQTRPQPSV